MQQPNTQHPNTNDELSKQMQTLFSISFFIRICASVSQRSSSLVTSFTCCCWRSCSRRVEKSAVPADGLVGDLLPPSMLTNSASLLLPISVLLAIFFSFVARTLLFIMLLMKISLIKRSAAEALLAAVALNVCVGVGGGVVMVAIFVVGEVGVNNKLSLVVAALPFRIVNVSLALAGLAVVVVKTVLVCVLL